MKTRQRASLSVDQRLARDCAQAYQDARAMALELLLACRRCGSTRWPLALSCSRGLTPDGCRSGSGCSRTDVGPGASYADLLVTDQGLLCKFAAGRLSAFWWSGVVGILVDHATEHLTPDFSAANRSASR